MRNRRDLAPFPALRPTVRTHLEAALWFALLIAPVVIGLVWGAYFDDQVYVTFRHARDLAAGRGLTQPVTTGESSLLRAPLYVVALALLASVGIPLPQAGLILSALGWGAAAVTVYRVGWAVRRPVAAVVSGVLVVCSPIVVSTLGTEISWTVAWAWIGIAAAVGKRWNAQTVALVLMLGTHFDVSALALATLLVIVRWVEVRRFPLWPALILTAAALGWGLLAAQQMVAPFSVPHVSVAEWTGGIRRLLDESEFYGLFLPLMGLGVLGVTRRALWAGLVGVGVLVLGGGAASGAGMATLGLFLAGLGVEWAIVWMEARGVVRLDRATLAVGLALVAGLALGVAQGSSLVQRYRFRPVVRQELEGQAADWLRAHSEPTAMVFGSQRIGYLADRPTFPREWDGSESDPAKLAAQVVALNADPPGYCISLRSIGWDRLVRTEWFQDGYMPLLRLKSPYDAASPLTIWGYRFSGAPRAVGASFGDQVRLLSYRVPDRVSPGAGFDVTLYWEPLRPPEENYTVFIHLLDADGQLAANHNEMRLTSLWPPGEVVPDVHHVVPDAPIPEGTYRLQIGMYPWPSLERLPVWDSQGVEQVDRVVLLKSVEVD
jgi:hypothetical protein